MVLVSHCIILVAEGFTAVGMERGQGGLFTAFLKLVGAGRDEEAVHLNRFPPLSCTPGQRIALAAVPSVNKPRRALCHENRGSAEPRLRSIGCASERSVG